MTLISKETLFAVSLFPYLGFLWFLTRSPQTPRLALAGFYLLLVFVVVTIPAGIYAQTVYGVELANVDWLHGSAEIFLTLSNVVLVVGLEQAVRSKLQSQNEPKASIETLIPQISDQISDQLNQSEKTDQTN
jgi:heme A synthase